MDQIQMSLFQQICKILDGIVDDDIKAELRIFTRIIVIGKAVQFE